MNKRVRPLRGRRLWGRPCSWVRTDGGNGRCHGNEVTRCKAARDPYATCQISSWSNNRWRSYGDFSPTTQLATVTLTSDSLNLKLVHGVLVSQGPFLPSLVFVGLFVFPLGGGTGQTDRQTDRINTCSRKDGPITNYKQTRFHLYTLQALPANNSSHHYHFIISYNSCQSNPILLRLALCWKTVTAFSCLLVLALFPGAGSVTLVTNTILFLSTVANNLSTVISDHRH